MATLVPQQLPLPVQLPDGETFSSFIAGENSQLVEHLEQLGMAKKDNIAPFMTFISGEHGVGKSHLLFALCHAAVSTEKSHLYISLKQKSDVSEQLLVGLEKLQLLCLDDIHLIANDKSWQVAIFDLINRIKEEGNCHLVMTANAGPNSMSLTLPDLKSRLSWGVSYQLKSLTDNQRILALITRAEQRGLNMSDEVASFLLSHAPRDMPSLMSVLNQLDQLSLQEKRKLTIPFVKSALSI